MRNHHEFLFAHLGICVLENEALIFFSEYIFFSSIEHHYVNGQVQRFCMYATKLKLRKKNIDPWRSNQLESSKNRPSIRFSSTGFKLMWKSTLAGFAKTDSELLSTLGPDRLDRFKIQVSAEAGADQDSDILTGTV